MKPKPQVQRKKLKLKAPEDRQILALMGQDVNDPGPTMDIIHSIMRKRNFKQSTLVSRYGELKALFVEEEDNKRPGCDEFARENILPLLEPDEHALFEQHMALPLARRNATTRGKNIPGFKSSEARRLWARNKVVRGSVYYAMFAPKEDREAYKVTRANRTDAKHRNPHRFTEDEMKRILDKARADIEDLEPRNGHWHHLWGAVALLTGRRKTEITKAARCEWVVEGDYTIKITDPCKEARVGATQTFPTLAPAISIAQAVSVVQDWAPTLDGPYHNAWMRENYNRSDMQHDVTRGWYAEMAYRLRPLHGFEPDVSKPLFIKTALGHNSNGSQYHYTALEIANSSASSAAIEASSA
jgi:hypothetical protein